MSLLLGAPSVGRKPRAGYIAGNGHRYWRITNISIPGGGYLEIGDFELSEANQVSLNGEATLTSSDAPTNALSRFADDDVGTNCYWTEAVAEGAGFYVQWDFGANSNREIVYARQAGFDSNNDRYISAFTLEYSDNGSDWTVQATQAGLTYPGAATYSSYYDMSYQPPSGHRYWRIINITVPGGGYLEISEFELSESDQVSLNSSATVTSSDTPTGSLSNFVDDDTGTRCYWTEAVAEAGGFYVQWDFGVANEKDVAYARQAGYDTSNRYADGFELQYSDDASSWTTQSTQSSLTYPGNNTYSSYYDVTS